MSKKSKTPSVAQNPIHVLQRRPPTALPTANLNNRLQQALGLHQQGELGRAEVLYRQVLSEDPRQVTALNFLGMLLHQTGQSQSALTLLNQALDIQPEFVPAWNNRGLALRKLGQHDASAASYQKAVALKPDYIEAWINFSNVLRDLQRPEEALAVCLRVLALKPNMPQALNAQSAALNDLGRHVEALACCAQVIALNPEMAVAHFNRGVALTDLQRYDEALQSYASALKYNPDNAIAWNNRGFVLDALRRHLDALPCYTQALKIQPDYTDAYINLGHTLDDLQRIEEALGCFDKAIALQPTHAEAHSARGQCLLQLKQFSHAAEAYATVLQLCPQHKFAKGLLFDALNRAVDWTALPQLRDELRADVRAGLPAAMPFGYLAVHDSAVEQLCCAQTYASDLCTPRPAPLWQGEVYVHDRIRVAYLSADFHDHATTQLMIEVFEAHNAAQFEISALSFGPVSTDAMRGRLLRCFHPFVDVSAQTDAQIAQWLHTHEIDIAVDLKGYTLHSRPGIFAHRGAPVQVNFLGYPGTLGADDWDYIIGDAHVTPPDCERGFSEQIVRMPNSYQPNCAHKQIDSGIPSRAELGLPDTGFVFCCFNNSYKITPVMFGVWMRLLQKTAGSVLWLLADDAAVLERLRQAAQAHGIAVERLVFAAKIPLAAHLARLAVADLCLDTLPVNAHTTASDALWAGLPVLTCSGESFASRVAGSLLLALELPELVTYGLGDYEALALRLAHTPEVLAELKSKLASNRLTHSLFNAHQFTRDLEVAYQRMANRFRQGLPPQAFSV